ncbi:MAG: SDR family NAD(P)-dependent oxidoreductase [Solirubrobacterales bacterium]
MELSLNSKVALITGASSGIGAGVAETFADAGAKTVLVGRHQDRLAVNSEGIKKKGCECYSVSIDLTEDGGPEQAVQSAIDAFGTIDVLVHAAGVFDPRSFEQTTLENFDRIWNINVRVPFALTQAALPHLKNGGVVIFLSSVDGHVGFASDSAYAPAKSAVDGLTRALSIELAKDGVRVVAVAPGFTKTPMNEHLRKGSDVEESAIAETPAGRLATVADIAACVLFLASDAASYTHGLIMHVDGGYPTSSLQRGMA